MNAAARFVVGLWIAALAACAGTLPVVPSGSASARGPAPVAAGRLEGGHGTLSQSRSTELFRRTRAEGRSRAFDHQLAILEQAGERLSAGNGVELLVDGPATFDAMFSDLERASKQIL
ncbi:MAG: cardiolipin synthase B, partial [Gammaproteobacteria bacterium]